MSRRTSKQAIGGRADQTERQIPFHADKNTGLAVVDHASRVKN